MNMKDCREEIMDPIMAEGWTAKHISDELKRLAEESGIEVSIRVDEIKSGGLFGNLYPCVILSHPNPPQSYFDHMIIINNNIISFYFWGTSKANYNANMSEYHKNSGKISGLIKSSFYGNDQMAIQTESVWHGKLRKLYNELWKI